jgi:hypothetical protein
MNHSCVIAAVLLVPLGAAIAAGADEEETIQKSFSFSGAAPRKVIVDNVEGSIQVTGSAGNDVRLVAHKQIRADSAGKVDQARREVTLNTSQDDNTITFYVDGPFRCHDGGIHDNGHRGYRVKYDFELQVPRDTAVKLKTINDGQIKVDGVEGDYDIDNINGAIDMTEAAGAGRVYALNGHVRVTFHSNPRGNSYFGSLNGEVRVTFQPDLSADLRFKTFNGGIYTDFESSYLPRPVSTAERRDGKFIYKSNEWSAVRVAHGGPELSFDGFNGNIRILSRGQ